MLFPTKAVSAYCIPPRERLPAAVTLSPACYLPSRHQLAGLMLWNELGRAQGLQPGSPELPPQTYTQGQQGLCLIGVVSPGARRGLEVGHPEVSSPLWLGPPPTTVRIPPRTGPCRALGVTWASYLSTPSQLQSPAPGRVVGISLPEARGRARLDPCQGSQCHLHHTEVRPCPHAPRTSSLEKISTWP